MTDDAITTTTSPVLIVEPPKKKRRRAPIVIGALIALVVLLVVAYFVLDNWARQQVSDLVSDKVHEVLKTDQPVDVQVAGFSVLAQAITGSLDQVDVAVDDVTIGDLTGDVSLVAKNIPVDLTKPVDSVQIQFVTDAASVQSLAELATDQPVGDVTLADGQIHVENSFSLFGLSIAIGVAVVPSAEDGQVAFTPASVDVNGATLTAEELTSRFGSIADTLVQTRTVCIADRLPAPLKLTDLDVKGKTIVLALRADDVVLDEASLSTLGTCP